MAGEQPKTPVGGAYGQFLIEKRAEFAKACAGQKASAITKMAGEEWKKLSDDQMEVYKTKYILAKRKFDQQKMAFIAAGGEKKKRKSKEPKAKKNANKDPNK